MQKRRTVAILGACRLMGQHLLRRLDRHPYLKVTALHDHAGDGLGRYGDRVDRQLPQQYLKAYESLHVHPETVTAGTDLTLSVLPDEGSAEIERIHAQSGSIVITHAEEHRLASRVPLVAPGKNHDVLASDAGVFATPNCTTMMLALPLHALHEAFGIEAAVVTTMQSVTGSDLPGLHWSQIFDTAICNLAGEVRALEGELQRLFAGHFPVSAMCARVPVSVGHAITVSLKLSSAPNPAKVSDCLAAFAPCPQQASTPTSIAVLAGQNRPSQTKDVHTNDGMALSIGGIGPCPVNTVRFYIVGNNLEAATTGALVQCAEIWAQSES